MPAEPILDVQELRVAFDTPRGIVRAVDGVNFNICPGETVAIVGESGSGKSVSALSALRLFSRGDRVSLGGRIAWRGRDGAMQDLLTIDEKAIRDVRGGEISIIFQDPSASLNPVFTIGDQICEAIRCHRPAQAREAGRHALDLLRDVGISDPEQRMKAYPHQLSGGMRQRVMIAIALACAPRLLIADEPTTALDVTIQAQIVRLLAELKDRHGMGLLFITHDLALVSEIADRVVVMYAGEVVESGPTRAVLDQPRHPYTRALLECRPSRRYRDDGDDERILRPIPGLPPRPTDHPRGCRFAPRCVLVAEECRASPVSAASLPGERMSRCRRFADMP